MLEAENTDDTYINASYVKVGGIVASNIIIELNIDSFVSIEGLSFINCT